jgi:cytochrome bd-type quinol oxidase subunit 2
VLAIRDAMNPGDPPETRYPDRPVQVALVGLVLLPSVLLQLAIPGWASSFASRVPEVTRLVVPYSAAAILFIACGQVALLAAWRFLWLTENGRRRSRSARRCADVIVSCAAIATMLTSGVLVHLLRFAPGGGGPSVYPIGLTGVIGAVATGLLLRWRRGLTPSVSPPVAADQPG